MFGAIPGYKNVIESQFEVVELFKEADVRLQAATPSDRSGSTLTSMWNKFDEEKELYRAVRFVLKERCSDIIDQVPTGCGYELFRLLALRYDPVMPHLRSMLMSSIYGLANEKCKDFRATVARIAYIERMFNEMADQWRHPVPEHGSIIDIRIGSSSH